MTEELEQLKKHLEENKHKFVIHYEMNGDTESGFYDSDEFDFDALMEQIDEFGEYLRQRNTK